MGKLSIKYLMFGIILAIVGGFLAALLDAVRK